MKFVLYIDYKAIKEGTEYVTLEAKNLEEAIEEADRFWQVLGNSTIYLTRIMKKVGKVVADEGYKFEEYDAILCRRSFGWYRNVEENSEGTHKVRRCWLTKNKDCVWYEITH